MAFMRSPVRPRLAPPSFAFDQRLLATDGRPTFLLQIPLILSLSKDVWHSQFLRFNSIKFSRMSQFLKLYLFKRMRLFLSIKKLPKANRICLSLPDKLVKICKKQKIAVFLLGRLLIQPALFV